MIAFVTLFINIHVMHMFMASAMISYRIRKKTVNAEILNKSPQTLKFHQDCIKHCEKLVSTSLHDLPFRCTISILNFFPLRLFFPSLARPVFFILFFYLLVVFLFIFFPNFQNCWLPNNCRRAL